MYLDKLFFFFLENFGLNYLYNRAMLHKYNFLKKVKLYLKNKLKRGAKCLKKKYYYGFMQQHYQSHIHNGQLLSIMSKILTLPP